MRVRQAVMIAISIPLRISSDGFVILEKRKDSEKLNF
jgi:hypothetical protein